MSTVLITGASGGIGYELAKLFARDHHNLVLVARRLAEKLSWSPPTPGARRHRQNHRPRFALPSPKFLFSPGDETLPSTSSSTTPASEPSSEFGPCPRRNPSPYPSRNITALWPPDDLVACPPWSAPRWPHHNVESTAAFRPGPLIGSLLRHQGVRAIRFQALADESRSDVTVTCFCPGATQRVPIHQTSRARRITHIFQRFGAVRPPPTRIASSTAPRPHARRTVTISGAHDWAITHSVRFAPRSLVTTISRSGLRKSFVETLLATSMPRPTRTSESYDAAGRAVASYVSTNESGFTIHPPFYKSLLSLCKSLLRRPPLFLSARV